MSPFDPFKGCSLVFNNLKVFTFNNFRVIISSKRGCFVHAIYFYKDKQGNQPVLDYMRKLAVTIARTVGSNSTSSTTILNCWASMELVLANPTSSIWMRKSGSWDPCGIGFYSWLGWMGALSYCIILSKRRKRHPDERLRKPSGSCKIWRKEG